MAEVDQSIFNQSPQQKEIQAYRRCVHVYRGQGKSPEEIQNLLKDHPGNPGRVTIPATLTPPAPAASAAASASTPKPAPMTKAQAKAAEEKAKADEAARLKAEEDARKAAEEETKRQAAAAGSGGPGVPKASDVPIDSAAGPAVVLPPVLDGSEWDEKPAGN